MGRLFGTDGVRGIANRELNCELAIAIGRAVAYVLRDKGKEEPEVLVGHDTRYSSDMLSSAICAGLCSMGANARILGVISTPGTAYLAKNTDAAAAIMISASHNPAEYNGIKIFSGEGFKLPDALEDRIEEIVEAQNDFFAFSPQLIGRISNCDSFKSMYTDHLVSAAETDLKGLNIAFDCANGSASYSANTVFGKLLNDPHIIYNSPDGYNINKNCGSTNIEVLAEYVRKNSLDGGFAFDGDADRCICVDETGDVVDGDHILAMCSFDMKSRGILKNNSVVGTVMTNYGFSLFCHENGIDYKQTKVGDRYVLEEMLLNGYNIGGEQSGHIIFGDYATTGDGQLTAIKVLSLMKRSGKKLSTLRSLMKKMPQKQINISASHVEKIKFYCDEVIQNKIKQAEELLKGNGRILVRPSGTEPYIRIMTEGADIELISSIANDVAECIKNNM